MYDVEIYDGIGEVALLAFQWSFDTYVDSVGIVESDVVHVACRSYPGYFLHLVAHFHGRMRYQSFRCQVRILWTNRFGFDQLDTTVDGHCTTYSWYWDHSQLLVAMVLLQVLGPDIPCTLLKNLMHLVCLQDHHRLGMYLAWILGLHCLVSDVLCCQACLR